VRDCNEHTHAQKEADADLPGFRNTVPKWVSLYIYMEQRMNCNKQYIHGSKCNPEATAGAHQELLRRDLGFVDVGRVGLVGVLS